MFHLGLINYSPLLSTKIKNLFSMYETLQFCMNSKTGLIDNGDLYFFLRVNENREFG